MVVPQANSGESKTSVQEVMNKAEEDSSPLSTSPSAKMIKIEELADVASLSPDQ